MRLKRCGCDYGMCTCGPKELTEQEKIDKKFNESLKSIENGFNQLKDFSEVGMLLCENDGLKRELNTLKLDLKYAENELKTLRKKSLSSIKDINIIENKAEIVINKMLNPKGKKLSKEVEFNELLKILKWSKFRKLYLKRQ